MIRTEVEYQVALARRERNLEIEELQRAELVKIGLSPDEIQAAMEPLVSFHAQLDDEIAQYENSADNRKINLDALASEIANEIDPAVVDDATIIIRLIQRLSQLANDADMVDVAQTTAHADSAVQYVFALNDLVRGLTKNYDFLEIEEAAIRAVYPDAEKRIARNRRALGEEMERARRASGEETRLLRDKSQGC